MKGQKRRKEREGEKGEVERGRGREKKVVQGGIQVHGSQKITLCRI